MAIVIVLFVISIMVTCAVSESDIGDVVSTATADRDFTVKLTGTRGLQFSGNCLVTESFAGGGSRSLEGEVPATYRFRGRLISCAFSKLTEHGTLTLSIASEGRTLQESSTSAPYGMASASAMP